MPVLLGSQPDHGFDQPLGLMRDCHRRIEKFPGVLIRVADDTQGGELDAEHREALDAALRYFSTPARIGPTPRTSGFNHGSTRTESHHV